jgi:hypothetical protein
VEFAHKTMGTSDVRIDPKLNEVSFCIMFVLILHVVVVFFFFFLGVYKEWTIGFRVRADSTQLFVWALTRVTFSGPIVS